MTGGVEPWSAGWAALQAGRPAEAERLARPALATDPGNAEGWFLLGLACHYQRHPAEAADAYSRALRLRPDLPDAHNNLGTALRELGRPAEAESCFRQALRLRPDFPEALVNLATVLQDLGRLAEAAECYQQALQLRPDFPEAHNNLGNVLRDQGQPAEAERHLRRALALRPDYPEAHNNLGNVLRQLGRLADAEGCFRQALRLRPDFPDVHNNLGTTLRDLHRPDEAEVCFRQALRLRPDYPAAHNNLGTALQDQGKPDEAAECIQRALRLRPGFADAHNNLGIALRDLGRPGEAEACFRQAVRLRPDFAEAQNNLGTALRDQQRSGEAEVCLRQALRLQPDFPAALLNLGNTLQDLGRLGEAMDCYLHALRLQPDFPEAHNNLGGVLHDLNRSAEAVASYARALALRPGYPEAHNNLGVALRNLGRLGEAEASYARALQLRPDYPEACNNLGSVMQNQGRLDEAEARFRQALDLRADYTVAHDGLLMLMHYRPGVTPEVILAAHVDYDRRHAAPLRGAWRAHPNDRDPERPLRVGLVSPDFGRHAVGYVLIRAVEALARRPGTVVCYSNRVKSDELTARFRAAAALWRDVASLSDAALAEQVRADGIDVLIDLAGHTGGNRLLAFARRPAPVQATWLGYVGTTGLEAMDYLIADKYLVPAWAEAHHRERVLRLPGGHAGYDPPAYAPDPGPVPALGSGRVTFGCFNNSAKLSPPALAAFAAVLQRVPGSRLVLKYSGLDDLAVGGRLRQLFAAGGVGPERVELRGSSAQHAAHLAAYREIDIALDPFPYAGVTTTCDTLWMGVPVVTLPGPTFASRHGLGLLSVVGLPELAAQNLDEYVAQAAGLAADLGRLADLRAGLRARLAQSPLCDGERLADELLQVLRDAWRLWASGGGR